ncbi:alpha/beta fold hydrolase [Aspergillus clavatus NRRL 1]|uniref:Alpha/beta fold family hydrolase, putative n=1 Tax=Aspergillus clavatus (strain ATCC 1007 / CBS 513.65 / DSM 816 / NCTC 3887 / NRRL 1 / QM 1276 / 107) TaxID=344612 RepID=A1CQK1_ASPCL|nr:alpha/beta fold family hydrolase, putative [Aspergillus clavatus NRRL 1]EAW07922.1 alpha/beta fold family hydrolase, putative [Aspergillus clavatus NRRL 1]
MAAMEELLAPAVHAPLQPASSSLLSRRRKSRSHSSAASSAPQVDQTSPEVITSLISSLSTISVPLQTHFDNVPRLDLDTGPSSPIFSVFFPSELQPAADQHPPSDHGFGVSYGAQPASEEGSNNPFLHPDDAADAPVIRMARAPPSPKPKTAIVPPPPVRPPSRSSYTSTKAAGEDGAFGMITSEPGPRVSTAPSIASTGSSGRRSLKSQLGLLKRSSREFMSDKDKHADRLRKTSSYNDSLRHNIPRSRTSLRSMHSMADVAEEARLDHFSKEARHETAASAPPSRDRSSSQSARASISSTPGGIGSGRVIPARESSLRHSFSSSPRKRGSTRHSRYSSTASREMKPDRNGGDDVGSEAEQVTRRIQELKDQQQRIKTELETDDSPEKSSKGSLPQPARPVRRSTDMDQHVHGNGSSAFEESAPAPAVMTGKSRTVTRNESAPISKNPNLPLQGYAARQSFDKPGSTERLRSRRSLEPSTPTRDHKRAPSNPASPNHASVNEERPSSADSIDFAVLEYISSPKLTQKVPHPTTGRAIAFSEVGDPRGHVVLCCLGMGLTRYLMAFYDELARSLNLRLVTLDRPGVGESAPYAEEAGNPLSWPDDVAIVCNHLKVNKFSILAHSAGAIYALATALRIPQHIRGRIHLLAPWIPPSQLSSIGSQKEPVPTNAVPYSQRILRALPASFLKVANSSFMSATSASITSSLPKAPRRTRRRATWKESAPTTAAESNGSGRTQSKIHQQGDDLKALQNIKPPTVSTGTHLKKAEATLGQTAAILNEDRERQSDYDNRLTHKIWELATTNANPAVDLLVCLERHQSIGFRYVDITRNVVMHHGSRDTRVPVDNVRWLGKTMRRCEVRVLEGEGHGLMASATVMGNVLMEIAKEWEDWMTIVQGRRRGTVGPRPALPS